MAQIARTEADKATNPARNASDKVAELGKRIDAARQPAKPRTLPERLPVCSAGSRCRGRGGAETAAPRR